MKMNLMRTEFLKNGIFGMLESQEGSLLLFTLEHSYLKDNGSFMPKIPSGTYTCIRGEHQLEGQSHSFETFEITGVEGHSNILFHPGNFNKDSEGCVLLGLAKQGDDMILHSRDAFKLFMELQKDTNSFALTVS